MLEAIRQLESAAALARRALLPATQRPSLFASD